MRIPTGQLGEDTSRLLGSLVLAHVWQAATARAAIPGQAPGRHAGHQPAIHRLAGYARTDTNASLARWYDGSHDAAHAVSLEGRGHARDPAARRFG